MPVAFGAAVVSPFFSAFFQGKHRKVSRRLEVSIAMFEMNGERLDGVLPECGHGRMATRRSRLGQRDELLPDRDGFGEPSFAPAA